MSIARSGPELIKVTSKASSVKFDQTALAGVGQYKKIAGMGDFCPTLLTRFEAFDTLEVVDAPWLKGEGGDCGFAGSASVMKLHK